MQRTSHYLGNHKTLTVTDRGDRMYLDTRDIMITPSILCWGSWESETTKTFERLLRPGMAWADIGANIGYFTIIGHRIVHNQGGKTFCFEPNPVSHEFLSDNIRLNWFFDNIVCENKAVYSKSTKLLFGSPEKYSVNASIGEAGRGDDYNFVLDKVSTVEIDAVSIDDYFSNQHLDFMKIDVEGAESYVLRGAKQFLDRNPQVKLLIEWSPGQMAKCKSSPEELVAIIKEFGFNIWLTGGRQGKIAPDDLLTSSGLDMVLLTRDAQFTF